MKSYSFPEREDLRLYRADTTVIPFSPSIGGEIFFGIRRMPDDRLLLLLRSTMQPQQFAEDSATLLPDNTKAIAQGYYYYDIRAVAANGDEKALKYGIIAIIGHIANYSYDDGGMMAEYSAADITSGVMAISRLPVAADGVSSATQLVRADDSRLGGGGAGGVTVHGDLTGLGNDDHPQYYNQARGDARYAQGIHTHSASAITSGIFALARLPVASDGISSATQLVRADDSRLGGGSDQVFGKDWPASGVALATDFLNAAAIPELYSPAVFLILFKKRLVEIKYNGYLAEAAFLSFLPVQGDSFKLISLAVAEANLPLGHNEQLPAIFATGRVETVSNLLIQPSPNLPTGRNWVANIHCEGDVVVGNHEEIQGQVSAGGTIQNGTNATKSPVEDVTHSWRFPHLTRGLDTMEILAQEMADDDKKLSDAIWEDGNYEGNFFFTGRLTINGNVNISGVIYAQQIIVARDGSVSGNCTLIGKSSFVTQSSVNITALLNNIAIYSGGNLLLASFSDADTTIVGAVVSAQQLAIANRTSTVSIEGALISANMNLQPMSQAVILANPDYWPI